MSIMQDEKVCYFTGSQSNLHKHHIYPGTMRKKSEKYGCYVWLRSDWHVGTPYAVHEDIKLLNQLKVECQRKFEQLHSHQEFMEVFKRNYDIE